MTVEEKRQRLREYCRGKICFNCVLHSRCTKLHGVYNNLISDENVNKNYDIVFKSNGVNADVLQVDELHTAPSEDPVNRPAHYTDGNIEVIEYIEDKKLGFCLGNAIKYISRAGKKNPDKEVEDLKKAIWYIERRIKELGEVM